MKIIIDKLNHLLDPLRNYIKIPTNRSKLHFAYQVGWNIVLLFIVIAIIGGAFGLGTGAGYFAATVKPEPLRTKDELSRRMSNMEQTSEIFFANDVPLGRLRTDLEREQVDLKDVSKHVKNAIISTEDEYFYSHNGVVPKAIFRAIFQEVAGSANSSGGSTLTQQVIKQTVLTSEVSFGRKFKEILLAQRLEKFFKKDEILEAYLNISPFGRNSSGRNIAGVQTASKGVFGIPAKDLNIPQSAFIAGLPNSPSMFTPFTQNGTLKEDLSFGINRMKLVLKRMYEHGYITKKEYNEALAYDITKDFSKQTQKADLAYPFIMAEVERRSIEILTPILAKKEGYTDADLKKSKNLREEFASQAKIAIADGGYKIYTTIDKGIYDEMEVATKNYQNFPKDMLALRYKNPATGKEDFVEPAETGSILIENATGKILSFVGGRDFNREQINHATQTLRSNGSTMKPLLVYAPAFEYGVSFSGKPLLNTFVSIPIEGQEPYAPENYEGGSITGLTDTREALKRSYNIPAILQYMEILNQKPATFLDKMGFTSLHKYDYSAPSVAIGALTNGVTVEENVNAYATFANGGQFIDAYMIEKIIDDKGNIIFKHETKKVDVFSPQTAYLMTDLMRSVVGEGGTAGGIVGKLTYKADWVGKTGTSQDYKDAWFVACSPSLSFGTWMGYDHNNDLKAASGRSMSYSQRNNNLWVAQLNAAYAANPNVFKTVTSYKQPEGIVEAQYDKITGGVPTEASKAAGLVGTALFNQKYLPKADGGTSAGLYVEIDGKKYLASSKTPAEFTSSGILLSQEQLQKMGYHWVKDTATLYKPGSMFSNVIMADSGLTENGKAPDKVSATLDGSKITWSRVNEPDIIGYYIYKSKGASFENISVIKANQPLEYNLLGKEPGLYYVLAVDIDGKVSDPSSSLNYGSGQSIPVDGGNSNGNGNSNSNGNGNDKKEN